MTAPLQYLPNFCWWCSFYKLKLREITKRCTYRSINILAVFEISQENVWCENFSGECLLWGFSLDKVSNFVWEETIRRLLFWVISEMFRKYDLSVASSQLRLLVVYYCCRFCYYWHKYWYYDYCFVKLSNIY